MLTQLFIFQCTDYKANKADLHKAYQQVLMEHFVQNTSGLFMAELCPQGNLSLDVCGHWEGVQCDGYRVDGTKVEKVIGVEYRDRAVGHLAIEFLPNTVHSIIITKCDQRFCIETRALPRDLIRADFDDNRIFGTLNLQQLPARLQHFDIRNNEVCGPIHLVDLPARLNYLNLSDNNIRQKRVYCQHLPLSLKFVHLGGERQSIGTLVPVPATHDGSFRSIHETGKLRIIGVGRREKD